MYGFPSLLLVVGTSVCAAKHFGLILPCGFFSESQRRVRAWFCPGVAEPSLTGAAEICAGDHFLATTGCGLTWSATA